MIKTLTFITLICIETKWPLLMLKILTVILLTLYAIDLMAHEVRHDHVCDDSGKCEYFFEKEDLRPDSQYIEIHHHEDKPPSAYGNAPIENDGGDPPSAYVENVPVTTESACEEYSQSGYYCYYTNNTDSK